VSGTSQAASPGGARPSRPSHPASTVSVRSTQLGDVLVDAQGRTLYGFTNDTNGTSTCMGACATSWPALTVAAGWTAGTGVDAATFHTVADGTQSQLVAGRWPLYRFAGDSQPGDVNGQGSLGKWFVVRADGSLFKDTAASGTSNPAPAMSNGGY
jgi:predicted lipoprotein with Yx(FWY)xxD motif